MEILLQILERDLSIFVKRLCADELLAELRRGVWLPLAPKLLLEPPSFDTAGSPTLQTPAYLTAIVPPHPYLANEMLELSILRTDYRDALAEIDSLGIGDTWREFFRTRQQLYRLEVRSSPLKLGETVVVRQNKLTGPAHRRAMDCIWRKVVVRDYVGLHCML